MGYGSTSASAFSARTLGVTLTLAVRLFGDDAAAVQHQIELLQQQNSALQQQVQQQNAFVETLRRRVEELEQASSRQPGNSEPKSKIPHGDTLSDQGNFTAGRINLSGEGGVAFFHTQSEGTHPNAEFRIDEARLFVESPVWQDVYFFGELNLATREYDDLNLRLGECYIDFESVSKLWNRERMLNLRFGRLDIPFGEEYQFRDAIDNPLVAHSLSDLWGIDEGIELYGRLGKFSYVAAVQNGGTSGTRDFHRDKAVVGRLGYDAASWLHLSLSGMRTGDLAASKEGDFLSELWFGNGWFRSLGGPGTTQFHVDLFEADAAAHWSRGHVKAFGGYASYDDNDPAHQNARDILYYSVEGVQNLSKKWYAASRFSQILAHNGYPVSGQGNMGRYFFSPVLTDNLWRLSLGLGYRLSENLLIKADYSLERGRQAGGKDRNHEDMLAVEAAMKF